MGLYSTLQNVNEILKKAQEQNYKNNFVTAGGSKSEIWSGFEADQSYVVCGPCSNRIVYTVSKYMVTAIFITSSKKASHVKVQQKAVDAHLKVLSDHSSGKTLLKN